MRVSVCVLRMLVFVYVRLFVFVCAMSVCLFVGVLVYLSNNQKRSNKIEK